MDFLVDFSIKKSIIHNGIYKGRGFEMESYTYLLALALILLSTKLLGLATAKIHMPQVVGALIAGIILGPSGIGLLESNDFLVKTAEVGVIMLMFTAGIDTDMNELKNALVYLYHLFYAADYTFSSFYMILPHRTY